MILRFLDTRQQNSQWNSLMINKEKTVYEWRNTTIWEKRIQRETNRAGMFLSDPLFAPGFAPLATNVHTDGQFLCKRKRQPRWSSTVNLVYAKYYDERNFWSFTRVFHLSRCFTLRMLTETRLFPDCFILSWCGLNAWTRCHQQRVKLVLRISLQTSYEMIKDKGNTEKRQIYKILIAMAIRKIEIFISLLIKKKH